MKEPLGYLLKVLTRDGTAARRFALSSGEHVVGSAPEVEIPLAEPGVSRRHARLRVLADGGVLLTDLGSKNGTFVGDRRIQEMAVTGLATLAFGSVRALLQPIDPVPREVVLRAGTVPQPPQPPQPDAAEIAVPAHSSTVDLHPLERLAESLREILPALWDGLAAPEEVAAALAQRWLAELPLDRVEFLRSVSAHPEPALVAAAYRSELPPSSAPWEIDGPEGWRLRVTATHRTALPRVEPLFQLALGALAHRRHKPQVEEKREAAPPPPGLGARMSEIYRRAGKVARGEVPVLIRGESGVGKEVLASWIHARSRRSSGPFLALNCAALPRELLEAELFGIERGVATGVEARAGLLERGSGGTVFLDEIGDMAPEIQAKVLRVLETPALYRVGGKRPIPIDVRFVAATHRDLAAMVEEGSFRRDLFHRLAAFEVEIPPLRERREEIPSLAARFFHREVARARTASPGITRAALGALIHYPWPGNVRELQNEIAKSVLLLEPGEPLELAHLSPRIAQETVGSPETAYPLTLEEAVRRAEREAFLVALEAAGDDAGRAMEILGVSRTTWYRKLKELGLA